MCFQTAARVDAREFYRTKYYFRVFDFCRLVRDVKKAIRFHERTMNAIQVKANLQEQRSDHLHFSKQNVVKIPGT